MSRTMPRVTSGFTFSHAEPLETRRCRHLRFGYAVVETHRGLVARLARRHTDVAKTIEVGADLTDLRRQELVVPDDLVLTEHPAGRRARDTEHEDTGAEQRHARLVVSPPTDRSCRF